ncbi:MAG: 4Fe-4S cluster-binding domain-containing protein, partial [Selenomonadaceae bacterium]|nr:4Fe-4S cluster-binding domain-containing protein [Selenomonadaceae bacterium]
MPTFDEWGVDVVENLLHPDADTGFVFDVRRFSTHDGDGIRTTVFFKGCPLSCVWCHNPEGISGRRRPLYFEKKCIHCGSCIKAA